MKERILLVDDDPFLVRSISRLLESAGFEVDCAQSLRAAEDLLVRSKPDLIILDLSLPDGDGVDLCLQIRYHGGPPILMLSSRSSSVERVIGLNSGADDYLAKPFDPHELVARVHSLFRRTQRRTQTESRLSFGDLALDAKNYRVMFASKEIQLTQTEFEVLLKLASRPDEIIEKDRLFKAVWGHSPEFASNSLEVIVSRIRKKIKQAGGPNCIRAVRGVGYQFISPV